MVTLRDNEQASFSEKMGVDTRNRLPVNGRKTTNWYVITGGPGSGKTTTINLLKTKGYKTTIEHARHYIDTQLVQGKTVEEVRRNQKAFQQGVLEMQIEQEAEIAPEDVVFLDRAIPDAMAYYRFLNIEPDDVLKDAVSKASYKKVFVLDLLPFEQDYARREDEAAQKKIQDLLIEVYSSMHFPLIQVPVSPVEVRVAFILENL
jgi:predicted ATPase